MIDWNIRFGDVLVVASLGCTVLVFAYKTGAFTESVNAMQKELESLKAIARTISQVLTTVATQKVEIEHIKEDIRELKHGEGFVRGPRGIDREYDP